MWFSLAPAGYVHVEAMKFCEVNVKGYGGADILMHELGHAMGLGHSVWQVSNAPVGAWRWSRGHDVPDEFKTIMSYGRGGTWLNVFSSPDSTCLGVSGQDYPCGVSKDRNDGADAVTTLDAVRFQVARIRAALDDTDEDGFVDPVDLFPNDSGDWWDADDDGVGDNSDVFPSDPLESADSDGDGVGDNADLFPNDSNDWSDVDDDGLGDNADTDDDNDGVLDDVDAFPLDGSESTDFDGDGIGDNADAFPFNPYETSDTDGDGVGDNTDRFPSDPLEWADSDLDGVGDNADLWPQDRRESIDTDGDGIGDNSDVDADGDGMANEFDAFPLDAAKFDLASYRFIGESPGDQAGEYFSSAGDGDAASFQVGVPQHDGGGVENAGAVYLVAASDLETLDAADGLADRTIELGHVVNGSNSWKFVGEAARDAAGRSVASTGDMDGDGQTDLLIGAPYHNTQSGAVYYVSGADFASADAADGVSDRTILLGHAAAQPGSWKFVGEAHYNEAGISVASVPDTDNDGKADLLIGAWGAGSNQRGRARAGATYLVASGDFSSADSADGEQDGVIDLGNTSDQPASWELIGEWSGDRAGSPVAAQGDIDGDGNVEIAINSQFRTSDQTRHPGAIYVVSTRDLTDADSFDGQTDGVVDLAHIQNGPKSWKLYNGTTETWTERPLSIIREGTGSITWLATANELLSIAELPTMDRNEDGAVNLYRQIEPGTYWRLDTGSLALVGDTDGDGGDNFLAASNSGDAYQLGFLLSLPLLADAYALHGVPFTAISGEALGRTHGIQRFYRALPFGHAWATSAGDMDGDGVSDILLGDPGASADNGRGTVFLLYGVDLPALDWVDGRSDERLFLWNLVGDTDADGVSNTFDRDDDGDRVPDAVDAFPLDPDEWTDSDGDGLGDHEDAFPFDNSEQFDTDGDGLGDFSDGDDDGDGIVDDEDTYPLDTNDDGTDNRDDPDDDGDGVVDAEDAFPLDPAESSDTDGDGAGNNADTDDDGDGVADDQDAFPLDQTESVDGDGDGVGDNADAFPSDPNETHDHDGDGLGNNADSDDDGDGVPDDDDDFPLDAEASGDTDEDGVPDARDAFPNDANESVDTDGDGVGDNADTDDDGDGVGDDRDLFPLDASRSTLTSYRFVPEWATRQAAEKMASAGDLDGDGRPELLIGVGEYEEPVYVISPADLVTSDEADGTRDGEVNLRHVSAQPGSWKLLRQNIVGGGPVLAPLGDLDGDSSPEFAVLGGSVEQYAVYLVAGADLLGADAMDGLADGVVGLESVIQGSGSWRLLISPDVRYWNLSVSAAQTVDADTLVLGQARFGETGSAHRLVGAGLLELDTADGVVDSTIHVGSTGGHQYFVGEEPGDYAGRSVAAYDFDGDGEADTIIGAPEHDAVQTPSGAERRDSGAVYLVGSRDSTEGLNDLGTIASRPNSWKFVGVGSYLGTHLSLGDFDGDGQPDLLLGSRGDLVVLSGTSAHLQRIDGDDGTLDGVVDLGRAGMQLGSRRLLGGFSEVSVVGDVDGDGMADILLGAESPSSTPSAARIAYLIPASSFFDGETVSLETMVARPGVYGFHVPARYRVSAITGAPGDVDGDGLDDLLLGIVGPSEAAAHRDVIAAYLVTAADLPHLVIDESDAGAVIHLSNIVSPRP